MSFDDGKLCRRTNLSCIVEIGPTNFQYIFIYILYRFNECILCRINLNVKFKFKRIVAVKPQRFYDTYRDLRTIFNWPFQSSTFFFLGTVRFLARNTPIFRIRVLPSALAHISYFERFLKTSNVQRKRTSRVTIETQK